MIFAGPMVDLIDSADRGGGSTEKADSDRVLQRDAEDTGDSLDDMWIGRVSKCLSDSILKTIISMRERQSIKHSSASNQHLRH